MDAEEIIAKALELQQGEKIQMRFRSLQEMNAMRMRLARKRLVLAPTLRDELRIESCSDKGKPIITIYCEEAPEIVFIKADGSETPMVSTQDVEAIVALMREDGRTEEEIDDMRKTFGA